MAAIGPSAVDCDAALVIPRGIAYRIDGTIPIATHPSPVRSMMSSWVPAARCVPADRKDQAMAALPDLGPRWSHPSAERPGSAPAHERPRWWPPEIYQPLRDARARELLEWLEPALTAAIDQAVAILRQRMPDREPRICRASVVRIGMSRLEGLGGVVPLASVTVEQGAEVAILTIGVQRSGNLAIRQTRPQTRRSRWHTLDLAAEGHGAGP